MSAYKSDVKLGELYEDTQTGYRGVASAIHFYQHACERITLEAYEPNRKEVRELTFDAPRLKHVKSGRVAKTTKTGGPARAGEVR